MPQKQVNPPKAQSQPAEKPLRNRGETGQDDPLDLDDILSGNEKTLQRWDKRGQTSGE